MYDIRQRTPFPVSVQGPTTQYNYNGTFQTGLTGKLRVTSGSYSSVKTPNFKALKSYQLPMNGYVYSFDRWDYEPGEYGYYNGAPYGDPANPNFHWSGYKGQVWDYVTFTQVAPNLQSRMAFCESRAKAKLLENLHDMSINVAQAYAERKQTVNMLTKSVNRLASAAIAVRRGNFRHAQELFGVKPPSGKKLWKHDIKPSKDNLSNHWLEFSYGWKPLLSDIKGAAELLAETYAANKPLMASGRHEEKQKREVLFYTVPAGSGRIKVWRQEDVSEKAAYKLYFRVDDDAARVLSKTGLSDPALLAWELLPYSFVVDWFVPIGDYLKSLGATRGLTFSKGTYSTCLEQNIKMWPDNREVTPGFAILTGSKVTARILRKRRDVLIQFPLPSLPSLDQSPLGVERALSGIALLNQVFSGNAVSGRKLR